MPIQTLSKTKTSTKIALMILSLSGVALAAGLALNQTDQLADQNPEIKNAKDLELAMAAKCRETDNLADFKVRGKLTAGDVVREDKCGLGNTLTEYYCDNTKVAGYSSWNYECSDTCSNGACQKLMCVTDADCNDRDPYTIATCDKNGLAGICNFKRIAKYFELKLELPMGEQKLSLISGEIKGLTGAENFDQFFAKDNRGYIVEAVGSNGKVFDSTRVNIYMDYVTAYDFVGANLIDRDVLTVKLPYGAGTYKSFNIYTPDKKSLIAKITLDNLPPPQAVPARSFGAAVPAKMSQTKPAGQQVSFELPKQAFLLSILFFSFPYNVKITRISICVYYTTK